MDKWDLMNRWDLVLPPSRPTMQHLALIRHHIQYVDRKSPVAVLGSTPEFTDLLAECGFEHIYVFEKNLTFYRSINHLRIYPEKIYRVEEGDWLETLPKCKGQFYLILSDLTSGNISYDTRDLFYNAITEALHVGGGFIDKVLTHDDSNIPVDDLMMKYSQMPLNLLYINYFSCEMLFCSELLNLKKIVDTSLFYSVLNEKIKNNRVRCFVDSAKVITPPGCTWYYGIKWDELIKDYCPNLELVSINDEESTSPYYQRLKYYIFNKAR